MFKLEKVYDAILFLVITRIIFIYYYDNQMKILHSNVSDDLLDFIREFFKRKRTILNDFASQYTKMYTIG